MIDKQENLIGADISKAHLSWLYLSSSNVSVNLDNLYWPNLRESDLRGNVLGTSEDFIEIMMHRTQPSQLAIPSSGVSKLAEHLYHKGKLLNLATPRPLSHQEETEREKLAHVFSSGKPLSEMIIEDRGPY
jgi:hypothetical protein